jgi:hypothetical protein
MTQQEEIETLKKKLHDRRKIIVDALQDPAVEGMWTQVVDKYSDQAHFIYEILQNADDAGATSAKFTLEEDRLVFTHNGTRHFSISDVYNERDDKKNGCLGDLNAITSVGQSNKIDPAKIGKFGMGFKSVFQYTNTPYIFEPYFKLRIVEYMVPEWLNEDFPNRKTNETVFIFPFDRTDSTNAKEEILEKLRNLVMPILFLHKLERISFEYNGEYGEYSKKTLESIKFNDTIANKFFVKNNNEESSIWLFSRKDDKERTYSVGFFVDDTEKIIPTQKYTAFCFFPTKVNTHLNFIVHAPFLLTDSREGIKANSDYNKQMILDLAELSADCIEYFVEIGKKKKIRIIDKDIIKIIPLEKNIFNISNTDEIGFRDFYVCIQNKLKSGFLPTNDGYISSEKAFWADTGALNTLISKEQLSEITNKDCDWIFTSEGRRNNDSLATYLAQMDIECLRMDSLLKIMQPQFIAKQPLNWLFRLYKNILNNDRNVELSKNLPIFLNTQKEACAAFIWNEPNLYLSSPNSSGYNVVLSELEKNDDALHLLKRIGVREPSLEDKILQVILKKDSFDENDFKDLIDFYSNDSQENRYIDSLAHKNVWKILGKDEFTKLSDLYYPNEMLCKYFENTDAQFLDIAYYHQIISKAIFDKFENLLDRIGIAKKPRQKERAIESSSFSKAWSKYTSCDIPRPSWSHWNSCTYKEWYLDGIEEAIKQVAHNHDKDLSIFLWNILKNANLGTIYSTWFSSSNLFKARYEYFYRDKRFECIDSLLYYLIAETKWLINNNGQYVSPRETYWEDISANYDVSSSKEVIARFDIKSRPKELPTTSIPKYDLETQQKLDELNDIKKKLENAGIEGELTDDDLEAIRKNRQQKKHSTISFSDTEVSPKPSTNLSFSGNLSESVPKTNSAELNPQEESPEKKIINETLRRAKEIKNEPEHTIEIYDTDFEDSDEFTPPSYDSKRQVKKVQDKFAIELNRIKELEEAIEKSNTTKYTYQWFQAMLQLEILRSNENYANSKEVHISFGKIDKDPTATKTLILSKPDKKIPAFMEELYGINIIIHFKDNSQDKQLTFEAASIRSFTLRLKMMHKADVDNLDIENICSVEIIAKSPVFLLDELKKEFDRFNFDKEKNLKFGLCNNIKFIFGPPGTGKTTYLAEKVLLPWMNENEKCNILVLAPTNKAADVLTKRVLGKSNNAQKFLSRFGTTNDEELESNGIFCSRNLDINTRSKNIVVTTMARLPYDSCVIDGKEKELLRAIKWDYIVIDEASMISLVYMVYLLYSQQPAQFVIAGDPFQIEPTVSEESWKRENIYKMIGLNDFANPKTEPHQYEIIKLDTQYRSIPAIGSIYSNLTYGGILKHHRKEDEQKILRLENLDISALNLVKFPVERYESIYRSKKLGKGSNYQIYSALFTYEFICHIAKLMEEKQPETKYSIGIISPYKAQSDLIGNLLRRSKLPQNISVLSGTVHSFQGDECDIMLTVFNSPENISTSDKMFLNHKNIINVAISRARDYLFVLMPDEKTIGIDNLKVVSMLAELMNKQNCKIFYSHELEKWIFGNENFLEENTFSTGHQSVNVYSEPEKRYEVRSEDDAIDIQIYNIG